MVSEKVGALLLGETNMGRHWVAKALNGSCDKFKFGEQTIWREVNMRFSPAPTSEKDDRTTVAHIGTLSRQKSVSFTLATVHRDMQAEIRGYLIKEADHATELVSIERPNQRARRCSPHAHGQSPHLFLDQFLASRLL